MNSKLSKRVKILIDDKIVGDPIHECAFESDEIVEPNVYRMLVLPDMLKVDNIRDALREEFEDGD